MAVNITDYWNFTRPDAGAVVIPGVPPNTKAAFFLIACAFAIDIMYFRLHKIPHKNSFAYWAAFGAAVMAVAIF